MTRCKKRERESATEGRPEPAGLSQATEKEDTGPRAGQAYLDAVLQLVVTQQLAVDAEQAEVALVVVHHAVALRGRLDEAGPQAALGALQGPQQVPVHRVDQTGALWNTRPQGHQFTGERLTLGNILSFGRDFCGQRLYGGMGFMSVRSRS